MGHRVLLSPGRGGSTSRDGGQDCDVCYSKLLIGHGTRLVRFKQAPDAEPTDRYPDSKTHVSRLIRVRPNTRCLAAPSQVQDPDGATTRSSQPPSRGWERHLHAVQKVASWLVVDLPIRVAAEHAIKLASKPHADPLDLRLRCVGKVDSHVGDLPPQGQAAPSNSASSMNSALSSFKVTSHTRHTSASPHPARRQLGADTQRWRRILHRCRGSAPLGLRIRRPQNSLRYSAMSAGSESVPHAPDLSMATARQ